MSQFALKCLGKNYNKFKENRGMKRVICVIIGLLLVSNGVGITKAREFSTPALSARAENLLNPESSITTQRGGDPVLVNSFRLSGSERQYMVENIFLSCEGCSLFELDVFTVLLYHDNTLLTTFVGTPGRLNYNLFLPSNSRFTVDPGEPKDLDIKVLFSSGSIQTQETVKFTVTTIIAYDTCDEEDPSSVCEGVAITELPVTGHSVVVNP